MRRRWLTRRAAARASVIFTDSAFSRAEIEAHLKADPSRVRVIPPGVASRARSTAAPAAREPIVLFVGSLFNRRRLPDLIAAFARLAPRAPGSRLVIVGDDRTWPRQDLRAVAAAHGVTDRVELLRYVSDEALSALYARASVFAFLSEYEGFGLTPLEALSAGVPPVELDTPVAREVYRDAAVFVEGGDLDGTAESLLHLLQDRDRAAAIVARGRPVVARYSWDTAADATLAELERIAGR
jgi:alpha-1,3-rhamnosyl/mannosyltransferase